jgi:hypothetical protein
VALRATLQPRIDAWAAGKKDNIRALLASLHTVLWEGSGWKQPSMADMVENNKVRLRGDGGAAGGVRGRPMSTQGPAGRASRRGQLPAGREQQTGWRQRRVSPWLVLTAAQLAAGPPFWPNSYTPPRGVVSATALEVHSGFPDSSSMLAAACAWAPHCADPSPSHTHR